MQLDVCRWLQLVGSETFTTIAASMRAAIKDSIIPLLCSLAARGTAACGMAILEPFEHLVTLGAYPPPSPQVHPSQMISSYRHVSGFCCATGRSSADIIAGRLQASQAKELRSFAVLNVAWSGIVRILLVLANLPEQARITQSM